MTSLDAIASHDESTQQLARRLSPELRVLRGPFAGLRCPEAKSIGSALLPKLLGTYEFELQPTIEQLCTTAYDLVVDLGCAEGYYAVGFASQMPNASILAVDISESALACCRTMADLNDVGERVETCSALPEDWAARVGRAQRPLILSDCEGWEGDCFQECVVHDLRRADLLIETHDFIRPGVTRALAKRFSETHWVSEVRSIHDHVRAVSLAVPGTMLLDIPTRIRAVAEGRPATMSWLMMRSKLATNIGLGGADSRPAAR